ncbi:hypothetical protein AA313_de0207973 [Arthrobotrys entomopaga]|nr:hypothetical protein AA313_de0207973 [Arthrobotrys entomopaga]
MGFWFAYFLGAFTFVPLLCSLVFALAYFTFPTVFQDKTPNGPLRLPADDEKVFASTEDISRLERKEKDATPQAESKDVAAGYFAVTREYVPGGVNGKPPERPAPNGNLPTESPSVYQTMYRSIFERKPAATASVSTNTRGKNVFFVVLRHGHLMLYDDSEQVEVRHVISLTHHTVSIYGGEGEIIPEGELYIKRNAIRLSRKETGSSKKDTSMTKPFFLFSENCSDKEDFYFALVKNQEREEGKDGYLSPSKPLGFETKHIISLVQRLHSTEEDLQTRWLNGLVGRLFLAMYRTNEVEDHIRAKVTKKIARVKRPAFLSNIVVQKIDCGEGAPFITNPKMRELTADGEFSVEGDVKYSGNFRIEISTVATLSLGNRFKPRQFPLVLAVVFKKLEGHAILRLKPPPSNRFWFTFSEMPKVDVAVEPVVSSRQITWNMVLRPIENRIKEVIAETVVSPNWDDLPFLPTDRESLRGGIWESMRAGSLRKENADPAIKGSVDDAEKQDKLHEDSASGTDTPPLNSLTEQEKSMSMPILLGTEPHRASKPKRSVSQASAGPVIEEDKAVSSSVDASKLSTQRQRVKRTPSMGASIPISSTPVVATTTVNASAERQEPKYDNDRSDAVSSVLSITRSRSSSESGTAGGGSSQNQTPYGSLDVNDSTVSGLSVSPSVTTIETGTITTAPTSITGSSRSTTWSTTSTDTNRTTNTAAENLKNRLGTFKSNWNSISFPKAFNNANAPANNANGSSAGNDRRDELTGHLGEVAGLRSSPGASPNPEKTAFSNLASTGMAIKKWYINTRSKNESNANNTNGNVGGNSSTTSVAATVGSGFHPISEMEDTAEAMGITTTDEDAKAYPPVEAPPKAYPLETPPKADISNKVWGFGSDGVSSDITPPRATAAFIPPAVLPSMNRERRHSALTAPSFDVDRRSSGGSSGGESTGSTKQKYSLPPREIPPPPQKRTAPMEVPKRKTLPPPLLPPRQNGQQGRTLSTSSLKMGARSGASTPGIAGEREEMMVIAAPIVESVSDPTTPGENDFQLEGVYLGNESPEERRSRKSSMREKKKKNRVALPGPEMRRDEPRLELPDYDGESSARKLSASSADSIRSNGSKGSRGSRGSRGSNESRWEMRERPYGRRMGSEEDNAGPTGRSWTSEEEEWRWRNRLVSEITGEEG